MLGHWRRFEQRRVPTLGSLSRGSQKPGQVNRFGEPPRPRWEFSLKRRGREREKERDLTWGEPDFQETSSRCWSEKLVHPLLPRKAFYTFDCTQRSMDNTKLCSMSSPDSYQDQAFSLHSQLCTQVLGDLHHLLARRPINILQPISDKGSSVVLPKVWCHSQKTINKVTFLHSKDTTIYNNERGVQ